jgi:endo-1,4-beta-xylanase
MHPRTLALFPLTALLACAGSRPGAPAAEGPTAAPTAAAPARQGGLRALADARGLLLGAAVSPAQLDDPTYAALLVKNFNYLTPENSLKWIVVHPTPDRFAFDEGDKLVAFARKNGMTVRGHTLTWHFQNPGWLSGMGASTEAEDLLREHIATVVGHYRGQIRDWDVVNEPLDENGQLRKSVWAQAIGPAYIEKAFRWAHQADPQARLFLNDYGVEELSAKSDAFYELVKGLLAKGVPLHGVGLQFHLDGKYNPDFAAVARNLERLRALGVEVQITELDVRLEEPATPEALAQQGQIYAELVRAALAYKLSAFVTWGFTDRYSWVPAAFRGFGHALPFDADYAPKPAALAIRDALAGPAIAPEYFKKFGTGGPSRTAPPFRAVKVAAPPAVDGAGGDAAWKNAYAYQLGVNQIAAGNMAPPTSQDDVYGTLRVVYKGTTLYGLLARTDDVTVTTHKDPWENDNFELFYRLDGGWKQIRTIVGQDWQKDQRPQAGKAVWSADGKVLEFEVEMGSALAGRTIGFSAALSDNDTPERASRKCQLYPIPGNNTGWQGKGFGELTLEDATGGFTDGPVAGDAMPFVAAAALTAPALDGDPSDAAWSAATRYPFSFNQLSREQVVPRSAVNPGTFKLVSSGGAVYGLVQLAEGAPARYDAVEVAFSLDGKSTVRVAAAGKDFAAAAGAPPAKAVWSKDGRALEFRVQLGDDALSGKRARFAIELLGVAGAGGKRSVALAPFPGYARLEGGGGEDLGALMSRKAADTATLLIQ